ncbi:Ribulose-5-phosphate 4-epimerase [Desulfurella amilsii]|uniref:Ribulose-5-phosphate 4-epimerase n=1 Tax=Desulfurella amilsii TaxID=1562698 RepID=A0A1X4Y038_9BACT|nr:class II aldolase/adducin family protein [Desulfurella amilsii]OSS43157.1 Ribulose-5-phosphate 4-epimerase [Desulfurella amilsii]
MISEFKRIGDMLFLMGLVDASSGNMSSKVKDGIWITKTGMSLFGLKSKDIVKIELERDVRWNAASSEVELHVNIYKKIDEVKAIVHAHSPYTVALSIKHSKITPKDHEGRLFLKQVDVLDIKNWDEAKYAIAQYFFESKKQIVVAKGHGVFAISDNLFNASKLVSALEFSSKIIILEDKA